jgi:hypothetical protein
VRPRYGRSSKDNRRLWEDDRTRGVLVAHLSGNCVNQDLRITSGLPVIRPAKSLQMGLSMLGLLDYRGWPRRRLHSPRAERMKVKPPSPPSAQSVQTKKKPPVDLAISP